MSAARAQAASALKKSTPRMQNQPISTKAKQK
jgi:hypothetical protein